MLLKLEDGTEIQFSFKYIDEGDLAQEVVLPNGDSIFVEYIVGGATRFPLPLHRTLEIQRPEQVDPDKCQF